MVPASAFRLPPSKQSERLEVAPRPHVKDQVAERVERIRLAMVNTCHYGFAVNLAAAMGWRPERRSRELNGTDGLSISTVYAEILLHEACGDQLAVDQITAALIGGLRTSSIRLTPGCLIKVFDDHGQLALRFDH